MRMIFNMTLSLEQQVCSLEHAKHLDKLGVKQKSIFYWIQAKTSEHVKAWGLAFVANIFDEKESFEHICSAFTVAELGAMLPNRIKIGKKRYFLTMDVDRSPYYEDLEHTCQIHYGIAYEKDTEANHRAKMLIYLIENGCLKL